MDLYLLPPLTNLTEPAIIPYAILLINFILFKLLRSLVYRILTYYIPEQQLRSNGQELSSSNLLASAKGKIKLVKLFVDELISTCELCADCAELNVVYELHGSLAYGLSLFVLTYLWIDGFGEAHTTPGYLVEDYFLNEKGDTLRRGDTYVRFIGQTIAMPLAWRFASLYWGYKFLREHEEMLVGDSCKSALVTSTLNGFLIELVCCLLCRLFELVGQRLLENRSLSQRLVGMLSASFCTTLVVLALNSSGGYFNPILAASLEYGCKGIDFYQHALVYWLGPLLGHVIAKVLFVRLASPKSRPEIEKEQHVETTVRRNKEFNNSEARTAQGRKLTRSNSAKRKKRQ